MKLLIAMWFWETEGNVFRTRSHFSKSCADYLLQNFKVLSLRTSVRTYQPVIILKDYCSRKA